MFDMGAPVKYPWPEIQLFYDQHRTPSECRATFGVGLTTWLKAARSGRLALRPLDRPRVGKHGNAKYDWAAIQAYYDLDHTYRECKNRFGFSGAAWVAAVKRGAIVARSRAWSVSRVLAESKSRLTVKRTLLRLGIIENRCEACGIVEWRGRPISIQLDHRNGVRDDHRLENLRMLCPNCHSQTETFAAKNRKRVPGSFNGRTPDSDSGDWSSNLCPGASNGPIV